MSNQPPQGPGWPVQPPGGGTGSGGPWQDPSGQQDPYGQPAPMWQQPPPRSSRKALVIGGSATAATLLIGAGGVLAFSALSGGGAQPADAVPANALAYVRVDLDPSAGQKVNAIRLLNRIPQFQEEVSVEEDGDIRRTIFEEMSAQSSCPFDYDREVEPWLGDRAAVAVLPASGGDEEPVPLFVLQVKGGEQDVQPFIDKVHSCGTSSEPAGFAFTGDYVVVAEDQRTADGAVQSAQTSSLDDDEQFSSDMNALDEDGLASFWVDVPALTGLMESTGNLDGSEAGAFRSGLEGVDSYYGALRAGKNHLELVVEMSGGTESRATVANPIGKLPADTLFAASATGARENFDTAWARYSRQAGYRFDSQLRDIETSTGLSLPADLKTLLGDNITFAMNGQGLTQRSLQDGDLSSLHMGLRLTGDGDAQQGVVDTLDSAVQDSGISLATGTHDDGITVATNSGYARALAGDGGLGGEAAFRDAVPDADRAVGALYLDVDRAAGVARSMDTGSSRDLDEALTALEPVRAIGLTGYPSEDGRTRAVLRVTFD